MIKIAVATLGCKTNQAESAAMVGAFEDALLVEFGEAADLYLINTCTVTNRTDYKSRNLIRRALKLKEANPAMKIVVTGCYSQRSREEVLSLGAVDYVIDNQHKLDLKELIQEPEPGFMDIMQAEDFRFRLQKGMLDRSRAFQKIQDGCDYYCSYCAVPYGRGHNRSARWQDVILQARTFVASGYKEIVLGGVNLGLYRDGSIGLKELLEKLEDIEGLEIIRLSSLEPQLFTDELMSHIQSSKKLAAHFHLAIQSASDSVLERMGRVYRQSLLRELIAKIKAALPHAAIGGDIICAFPGETDLEFNETFDFLQDSPLCYLHVFQYSKRKGTPAASMPDQINGSLAQERSNRLISMAEVLKDRYKQQLVEQQVPLRGVVDWVEGDLVSFLSDHYIRGYVRQQASLGELVSIDPNALFEDGLIQM
jgi:threonylcarbamoyladenosine tRNA methylthiotransferase MtaB